MIPTTPGSYEFKGTLYSISEYVEPKDYRDWSRAEVYPNEVTGNLCACVWDGDGHYSAAPIGQLNGEWRVPTFVNYV